RCPRTPAPSGYASYSSPSRRRTPRYGLLRSRASAARPFRPGAPDQAGSGTRRGAGPQPAAPGPRGERQRGALFEPLEALLEPAELLLESFDLRRPGRLGERRAAPNSLNEDAGRYERYQQSTHSRLLVRAGRIRDPAPGDGRLTGSW